MTIAFLPIQFHNPGGGGGGRAPGGRATNKAGCGGGGGGGGGGRGEVVLTRKLLHSGKPRAASPPLWSGSLSPGGGHTVALGRHTKRKAFFYPYKNTNKSKNLNKSKNKSR